MEAIVLDGNERSTLAATRSLGRSGVRVTVGAETQRSLASCSRYCLQSFVYASPYSAAEQFRRQIVAHAAGAPHAVLFPMSDVTLSEVLSTRTDLGRRVIVPFPNRETVDAVSNKITLNDIAERLNIQVPKTLLPAEFNTQEALIQESTKLGFPLVVKPVRSRIQQGNGWLEASVRYAYDVNELRRLLQSEPFYTHPFCIQERIEGALIGVFILMQDGNVLAHFTHRRIREIPPSGGTSVLCESIAAPPPALCATTKLLRELNWSGVAMAEFKWDRRDNRPKLIEINPRFWGSLQLAISSGVDFPLLLFRLAVGEPIQAPTHYTIGLKSRWELGDLHHLLVRLARRPSSLHLPSNAPSRGAMLQSFLADCLRPSVRNEVLRPDDPAPFFFELKHHLGSLHGKASNWQKRQRPDQNITTQETRQKY